MSSLYTHQIQDQSLKSFILKSLGGHVAIFGLIFGFGIIVKSRIDTSLSDENLTLIEASVRVDVVAMPKMTVRELQALQRDSARPEQVAAPAAKVEAAAPVPQVADNSKAPVLEQPAAKPRPVSDILKEAAQRRKQENAPAAKTQSQNEGSDGLSPAAQERLRALVAAGNKLSTGSALTGSGTGEGEVTPFHLYISQLPDLVRVHWRLPSYLSDQGLRCRIRIYLSARGDLVRAEIHESSGNDEYDRRALEAVRASTPFPPMDEQIAARGIRGEVLLGFPL